VNTRSAGRTEFHVPKTADEADLPRVSAGVLSDIADAI